MKLIKTVTLPDSKGRESEIFLMGSGRFEVFNSVSDSLSYSFPVKDYKTVKAAETYALKFLKAGL